MSTSTTFYNRSIRDAGNLADQNQIYSSFRSLKRYDADQLSLNRASSRHDDIFQQNEFETAISAIPVAEDTDKDKEKSSKNTERRRKSKNHKDQGESGREHRDPKEHRKRREPREDSKGRGSREHKEHKERHEKNGRHSSTRNKNDENSKPSEGKDDDAMDYLNQRRERRRKKKLEEESTNNIDSHSNSFLSKSKEPSSTDRENQKWNQLPNSGENDTNLNRSKSSLIPRENRDKKVDENGERRQRSSSRARSSLRHQKNSEESEDKEKDQTSKKSPKAHQFMLNSDAFSALPPTPTKSKASDSDSDTGDAEVQVDDDKNQPFVVEKINYQSEYFRPIKHCSTMQFLLTPAPQGKTIHCKIRKGQGILSDMQFYLEDQGSSQKTNLELLMRTHRRISTAKIYHSITAFNYDEFWTRSSSEPVCGRIVSNISRKKFKLDLQYNDLLPSSEILNIEYKQLVGEPRKITAKACLCAGATGTQQDKVTYILKNRMPYYDHALRKFVLNYNGRAKLSSKHNFQIVDESYPEEILMQLGKVGNGFYNCDFSFPFCALQAFGFALSSLCK